MLRALLYAFLLVAPLSGQSAWNKDLELPTPAPVVDEAGVLDSQQTQNLEALVRTIKARSGVEISVYLASSLRGQPIEEFSLAAAEKWGLGAKKVDKGLLFLVAPQEHKMRFEVGYGLEGDITDAFSRRVLDNQVRPYFKQGDYYNGILVGISAIQEKVPLGLQENEMPKPQHKGRGIPFGALVLGIWAIFFILSRLGAGSSYRSRYGGPWWFGGGGGGFGGGGGGGSWGGGGGGFGGGGASSDW